MKSKWKCPKCGSEAYDVEELVMYGRYGFMGRGYRFYAVMCRNCGFTEFYFKERTTWV